MYDVWMYNVVLDDNGLSIMPRYEIVSREIKQIFRIQTEVKCNSSNIIYMIEYASCGIQYVDPTKTIPVTSIH